MLCFHKSSRSHDRRLLKVRVNCHTCDRRSSSTVAALTAALTESDIRCTQRHCWLFAHLYRTNLFFYDVHYWLPTWTPPLLCPPRFSRLRIPPRWSAGLLLLFLLLLFYLFYYYFACYHKWWVKMNINIIHIVACFSDKSRVPRQLFYRLFEIW